MKKISAILMIAAIGLLMVSAVAAIELTSHDFDGNFKMDVPKNASIKKTDSDGFLETAVCYEDSANHINITYDDDLEVTNEFVKQTIDKLKKAGAKVITKDKTSIVKSDHYTDVIFYDGNKFLMVESEQVDADTLESMVNSTQF